MGIWNMRNGKPEGELTAEEQKKCTDANNLFVGCLISVISDHLVDVYIDMTDAKVLWDAGSELCLMESFHDYRMVNNYSVVEQVHEVQCIVKDLELLKCQIPDKFVAGCIIAKLPSSWRNFATTLKHRRQEISVENLIASLDVEEKARKKDTAEKGDQGHSSANMVQGKFSRGGKNKGNKVNKTTTFTKKKNKAELKCYTCGEAGSKNVNMVTISNTGDGYGNLPTVLSVFLSMS
ncbi:unnamed protein product [Urochloa humidicola]